MHERSFYIYLTSRRNEEVLREVRALSFAGSAKANRECRFGSRRSFQFLTWKGRTVLSGEYTRLDLTPSMGEAEAEIDETKKTGRRRTRWEATWRR